MDMLLNKYVVASVICRKIVMVLLEVWIGSCMQVYYFSGSYADLFTIVTVLSPVVIFPKSSYVSERLEICFNFFKVWYDCIVHIRLHLMSKMSNVLMKRKAFLNGVLEFTHEFSSNMHSATNCHSFIIYGNLVLCCNYFFTQLQLVPRSRKCGSIYPLPHTPS
jgi:hypothetical protein